MARKEMIFGYVRVSTPRQKIDRQIDNIKAQYPEAEIYQDKYTGTKLDRPGFQRMMKVVRPGDTIVFDEVSRMSRNAEEGYALYEELYEKGVELIFLKEPHINTSTYKEALQTGVPLTGTDIDDILKGVNNYLKRLAKRQIELSFRSAQEEIDYLHRRTSEGVRKAQRNGKRVGCEKGRKLITKKSIEAKTAIQKWSRDFDGTMSDKDCMRMAGVSRNSFYKYKRELLLAL